ncbi:MAG: hypothetical protein ACRC33_20010 [Gemmataceae bacterium]
MSSAAESLDARARELDRQLGEIIADAPLGRMIRLPQIGVTIEVVAAEGEGVRVGIVAPPNAVVRRASLPAYSGIPEIDFEDFARHAMEHPFVPTQAMIDEDWSDLTPKKGG